MNEVKSTTLELTINPNYVKGWGLWEAVRELIQNALDSHDNGHEMEISRGSGEKKTIRITNNGTVLERKTLLLGMTDKDGSGSSARGKFGEGYKLAFLVLCRMGVSVQVRTGAEMWTPFLETSAHFGEELLKVKIRPQPKYEEKVEIQIHGISDEVWETVQSRLIDVPGIPSSKRDDNIVVGYRRDKILTSENHRGKLFCKGLYVGVLPGTYLYGYDLSGVELDRDRKMADQYSLRVSLRELYYAVFKENAFKPSEIYRLLDSECAEADLISSAYEYGSPDALTEAMAKEFVSLHGDAIPVATEAEVTEASHLGINAVIAPKGVRTLVSKSVGNLEKKKVERGHEARTIVSELDLTVEERDVLNWAIAKVKLGVPDFNTRVEVVEFFSPSINGTHSANGIRIARRRLLSKVETISTLVHEVAHAGGLADGSHAHMHAIQLIFARIVAGE
jgi:hypothetical protein